MNALLWIALVALVLVAIARLRISFALWSGVVAAGLAAVTFSGALQGPTMYLLWGAYVLIAGTLNLAPLRRKLISAPVLRRIKTVLPAMSETERTAIAAGTVGWEAELFGGDPDWERLLQMRAPRLSEDERAFLDGPVEELCAMLDDWQITHELNDLPEPVWAFLKQHGFFGMIIPREFGGLGFSALAHSSVIIKIASRSGTAACTVMVPNSLGPAELIYHYGTDEQKHYYLPRLANGEEIPCFGLTGPEAGSDAGAMPDVGIVCKGMHDGEEVLGFRTNWEKRYITLGPVATLLGLAFKARDPDGLLGEQEDLGITCALVPTDTEGVTIGNRHLPTGFVFQNGPNQGRDVFIPLEWVIGGSDGVGQGWRMLMESLSAGRGISLPAMGAASGMFAARVTGAYARVRRQFNLPIGRFEGIEEPLARIGGLAYMMNAGRLLTAGMLDAGEKPSVVSAILKYHNTEGMRQVVNDAMDVHGGRGICQGPSNYLASAYQALPIGITVEGANILTRSMIVFGQGAMRCHPYLLREIEAAHDADMRKSLVAFDKALYRHLGFTFTNAVRSLVYGVTRSRLVPAPVSGIVSKYYRRLARMSAAYAFLADLTLLFLGGELKRREKLSGRFADALIYMFICSAVLKRFEDTGRPPEDMPLLDWSARFCLFQVQGALDEIMRNFPSVVLGQVLRPIVFPLGRRFRYPNDRIGRRVARLLLSPSEARDRLTAGIYLSDDPDDITGRLEYALEKVLAAEPVEKRLRDAGERRSDTTPYDDWLQDLLGREVIDATEKETLRSAHQATRRVVDVDDFAAQTLSALAERAA
ncbi:MAG: acyl-CoA dehydrogenase [Gammaproteobacteria bacterium]|nr:acyl-CoA dehydrogenase [Gammaproteobacteria bacterium]